MLKRICSLVFVSLFVFVSVFSGLIVRTPEVQASDVGTKYMYDFGTSTSPVEPGYNKVTTSSIYISGGGSAYGFLNATSSVLTGVDRGTPTTDSYKRDFIMRQDGSALRFRCNTMAGSRKRVTVTVGDTSAAQDSFDLAAEYNGVYAYMVKNESIPAGEIRQYSIDLAYTGAPINVEIKPVGTNTTVRLNAIVIEFIAPGDDTFKYDVGNGTVETGYTKLNTDVAYNTLLGYGWTDTTYLSQVDRGAPDALRQDYITSTSGTFEFSQSLKSTREFYKISITTGDYSAATVADDIYVEGFLAARTTAKSAGQFETIDIFTGCTDGKISIQFGQNICVNAIVIEPTDYKPWKYDMGTATSPVEPGYIGVSPADTYTDAKGYGIIGTVDSRDRSGGTTSLNRDFIMAADWSFKQSLVSKYPYWKVTLTIGDASGAQKAMEIYAEDTLMKTVTVPAGSYSVVTLNVTCTDGDLDLRFRGQNGTDWARVNALVIEPDKAPYTYKYDMGTSASPVEAGYTGVTEATAYSLSTGYGWANTAYASSRDRAVGDNLNRDYVYFTSGNGEFIRDLPTTVKDWKVTITVADTSAAIGEDIIVEGNSLGKISTTATELTKVVETACKVYDGQLNIIFKPDTDLPRINAIVIEPLVSEAPWKLVKINEAYGGGFLKVEDVNNDNEVEVISATSNQWSGRDAAIGTLSVQKLDGTTLWTYGTSGDGVSAAAGEGPIIIYDIDQDGQKELLTTTYGTTSYLRIFNAANGTLKQSFALPENIITTFVQVANLTGDAYADDLIIKDNYYHIYAFSYNKGNIQQLWMQDFRDGAAGSINKFADGTYKVGSTSTSTFTGHNPLIVDLDNDGKDEIITGVWCLNPDGTERWHTTDSANTVIYGTRPTTLVKVIGNDVWMQDHQDDSQIIVDGGTVAANYRILLTYGDCGMFCVDGNGQIIWERHDSNHKQWGITGDFLPNAGLEIYDFNSAMHNASTGENIWNGLASARATRDWNNDGYVELVSPSNLNICTGAGVPIARLHNPIPGGLSSFTPFKAQLMSKDVGNQKAVDIDLDGRADLVTAVRDADGNLWVMIYKNESGAVVTGTHRGMGIDTYGY